MKHSRVSAAAALEQLKEGNRRFVSNMRCVSTIASRATRESLLAGQTPFAIVLACSDSRAPAEIVFDVGLGDLFVIRVAGNVTAPSIIGSVEFAAAKFGTELVVVMGHTHCGAIEATLDRISDPSSDSLSHHIDDIVSRIRPGILHLAESGEFEGDELADAAVEANVHASAKQLRRSAMLQDLARNGLQIVEAKYNLATGHVAFLDPLESSPSLPLAL